MIAPPSGRSAARGARIVPLTRRWTALLGTAAVLILAACGAGGGEDADDAGGTVDPRDREWVLQELGGEPPLAETQIDLTLTEDRISGSSGCNQYMGAVAIDGQSFSLESELASTMKACVDEVAEQEAAYLAALAWGAGFAAPDDELRLLDEDGETVAVFG